MAHNEDSEWVELRLENKAHQSTLVISGVAIESGELFDPSIHSLIDPTDIIGTEIAPNKGYSVGARGKAVVPNGTEGTLDIKEKGSERVTKIWWNCPHWSSTNDWKLRDTSVDWTVEMTGGSHQGPIGTVTVKFVKNE